MSAAKPEVICARCLKPIDTCGPWVSHQSDTSIGLHIACAAERKQEMEKLCGVTLFGENFELESRHKE